MIKIGLRGLLSKMLYYLGKSFSFLLLPKSTRELFYIGFCKIYTGFISNSFKSIGNTTILRPFNNLVGGKYIIIGNETSLGKKVTLTAWGKYYTQSFEPELIIGDNCAIGDYAHITCVNRIVIGNGVLTGKNILITDNAHGKSDRFSLSVVPAKRKLVSAGQVVIEDNVWIGDKVSILPNVHIGEGSVVAANSVVTKNVPKFCIVAGVPATIIKHFI